MPICLSHKANWIGVFSYANTRRPRRHFTTFVVQRKKRKVNERRDFTVDKAIRAEPSSLQIL